MSDSPEGSYFERLDDHRFAPTVHTGGGWDPDELHFAPLGGLLAHAIELHVGAERPGMVIGRITLDILGRLAKDTCEVRVETARPGRTIELVEATLLIGGRPVILARAWLLASFDTSAIAGPVAVPLTPPEELAPWSLATVWPGGFVASVKVRPIGVPAPGRTMAWLSTDVELVAGEDVGDLASYVALVDTANGIAARESPEDWMFPNVDLSIHFFRQPEFARRPEGRWVGFDTTATFGPTGQGVTSTVLHDVAGPVGYAQQLLTVRAVPKGD